MPVSGISEADDGLSAATRTRSWPSRTKAAASGWPAASSRVVDPAEGRSPESGAPWSEQVWDLVVIGGGNAAVVAAMAANDDGARVLILERAPRFMRGGNTRHTRNIRCVHKADEFNSGDYSHDELWADLCNVGEGPNDEELARFTVRDSETMPAWMYEHGARWQSPLAGTLHLTKTNRFFFGGGKALLNSYYREIDARPGITAVYDAKVEELEFDGTTCTGLIVSYGDAMHRVVGKAVVCASGGFEANIEWLRRYWGDAVDNYIIRGTPHNDGNILALLYEGGAARAGQERGFHAIALDARAPKFDGGIATRLDTVPFGVVLNHEASRFYDEGEEVWPKRYAIWGRLIAEQPEQLAVTFWDSKVNHLFLPPMYGVDRSNDLGELATRMGLDPVAAVRTIEEYNRSVVPGSFDSAVLDDCRTEGLTPPKSHWAQRLDAPPYYAIRMRPGVTFTYMGVAIEADARIKLEGGGVFENVYAAGEIMSGNILSTGYLAGFGMTIGSVWGRQAGREAAHRVLQH